MGLHPKTEVVSWNERTVVAIFIPWTEVFLGKTDVYIMPHNERKLYSMAQLGIWKLRRLGAPRDRCVVFVGRRRMKLIYFWNAQNKKVKRSSWTSSQTQRRNYHSVGLSFFFHGLTAKVGLSILLVEVSRRNSLDEWSACRRDLYLTVHYLQETFMSRRDSKP